MIRTPHGEALKLAGKGRRWPAMVVGLIGLNASIVITTVVLATSDKSFAIEPDYYKKAVEWDRTARERGHAAELGWDINVSLNPAKARAAGPTLRVTLARPAQTTGQAATPLDGAQVRIEAFPQARSGWRISGAAAGIGKGVYDLDAPVNRPGVWEVRIHIQRGPDAAAVTRTLIVPTAPPTATGATP
ncbi:MAG: FixH family protein [Thermoleophilia bacterium]|nr:FixH family protein [Thermoleophilia bacterium]